jgi:hypothetical protein
VLPNPGPQVPDLLPAGTVPGTPPATG